MFLVNANEFATFGTCPSAYFLLNEISYTDLLYVLKIINHAHTVFCFVSRVELVQPVARVLPAIEAILQISCLEYLTLFYPTQGSGFWLRTVITPAPGHAFFPQI